MAKTRNTYRTFSTSQLKVRSSIPDQADITEGAGVIQSANITTTKVRNAIGAGINSVLGLCTHANVNQWSNFSPKLRGITGSGYDKVLSISNPSAGKLGDFAGYNHNALAPGWQSGGKAVAETDIWVNASTQATAQAWINIGELDYPGAAGVVMLIFDSLNGLVGWGQQAISAIGSGFYLQGTTGTIVSDRQYHARAFIVNSFPIAQIEDVASAIIHQVPNVGEWYVNLKVKIQSILRLNGTLWNNTSIQTVGTSQFSGIVFNAAAGTISLGNFKETTGGLNGLQLRVQVLNWLGSVQSSGNIYDNTDNDSGFTGYGSYVSDFLLVPNFTDLIRAYDAGVDNYAYGYTFIVTALSHA